MLEKPAWSVPALPGDLRLCAASATGEEHSHRGAKSRTSQGQGSQVQGTPVPVGATGQALCRTPAQDPSPSCRASEKLSPYGTGWHQGEGLLLAAGHGGCAWPPRLRSARQRRGTDSWCCNWGAALMAPSCARSGTGGARRCGSSVSVRVHAVGRTGTEQRGCSTLSISILQGCRAHCWCGCGRQRALRSGESWSGCGCSSSLPWSFSCRTCAAPTTSAASSPQGWVV